MSKGTTEVINVLAVFAGMRSRDYVHRVSPLRFRRKSGEWHRISKIRRVYRDQKGLRVYVHFVVETEKGRHFDIVFDPGQSLWTLVLEIDACPGIAGWKCVPVDGET